MWPISKTSGCNSRCGESSRSWTNRRLAPQEGGCSASEATGQSHCAGALIIELGEEADESLGGCGRADSGCERPSVMLLKEGSNVERESEL